AKIAERFQDQPLVEAAIRTAIGEAYGSIGLQQPRLAHLERALALRQAHLGLDHPETIASMRNLAISYSWTARYEEAIDLRQQILAKRKSLLGPDHVLTLECMHDLAEAYK